jgi:hypothetical protein
MKKKKKCGGGGNINTKYVELLSEVSHASLLHRGVVSTHRCAPTTCSNQLCSKPLFHEGLAHCSVGLYTFRKAKLQEGFSYIPSNGDHPNTQSMFLSPSVDAALLPQTYMESLQNQFSLEQWVSFFTLLTSPSKLVDTIEDHQEAAMTTLINASRAVSFADTPQQASNRPRLTDLVTGGTVSAGRGVC